MNYKLIFIFLKNYRTAACVFRFILMADDVYVRYLSIEPAELVGGTVASWLVRSTPERAVRVGALAGDIVLCS